MKVKLTAVALFTATAGAVALHPFYRGNAAVQVEAVAPVAAVVPEQSALIEVVFVLDTTGSMGGLIQAAKEKIWSIATTMASANQAPEIRMGLVAYRDRGDAYVTKSVDLSTDLDSVYAKLMDFRAEGGGDGPESVNQALHDAVTGMSWSSRSGAYKAVFLVGDAPPHMDYAFDVKYPEIVALAQQRGIVVNAIQCGARGETASVWQHIAQLGGGGFFSVGRNGSAVAVATPFDAELAKTSRALDDTRLYYGAEADRAVKKEKVAATDKLHASSSITSRARRATFNASASGKINRLGEGELVEAIFSSGRVNLDTVEEDELPEPLQAMSPEERKQLVDRTARRRGELEARIETLAEQRRDYLDKKVDEAGGAADSLDQQLYRTVREQAAKVGLSYEDTGLAY